MTFKDPLSVLEVVFTRMGDIGPDTEKRNRVLDTTAKLQKGRLLNTARL